MIILPKECIQQIKNIDNDFFVLFKKYYCKNLYNNKRNIIANISSKQSNIFTIDQIENLHLIDIQNILK
jgi:hypothetical protein